MDDAEKTAHRLLLSLGYEDIVFEPDGNVTPDFLIDKSIAAEVRRLVVGHDAGGRVEPLKTAQQSLARLVGEKLAEFGSSTGNDYYVSYQFERPMPPAKAVRSILDKNLKAIQLVRPSTEVEFDCGETLEFTVTPAGGPLLGAFRLGCMIDRQHGGWVVSELIGTLKTAFDAKARPNAKHAKYARWWLILFAQTGLSEDPRDFLDAMQHVEMPALWEKVVVILDRETLRHLDLR